MSALSPYIYEPNFIYREEEFIPFPTVDDPIPSFTTQLREAAEAINVSTLTNLDIIHMTIECLKSIHFQRPVSDNFSPLHASVIENFKNAIQTNKGNLADISAAAIFFDALFEKKIRYSWLEFDLSTQSFYCHVSNFISRIKDAEPLSNEAIKEALNARFEPLPEQPLIEEIEDFNAIKEAVNQVVHEYKTYYQPLSPLQRFSLLHQSQDRKPKNQALADALKINVNNATNIHEIKAAFRFALDGYSEDKGIKPYSLISFILKNKTLCDATGLTEGLTLQHDDPAFFHTSAAAAIRIEAKNLLSDSDDRSDEDHQAYKTFRDAARTLGNTEVFSSLSSY